MSDLRQRVGRFSISCPLIASNPADVLAALDGCIVLRAEAMWHSDTIEYVALHADFDPIPAAHAAPKYDAVISGGKRRWEREGRAEYGWVG